MPRAPEANAPKVLDNRQRSLLRRLRLEARHANQTRAETVGLGPASRCWRYRRRSAASRPGSGRS